jgi:hypothetical protein
MQWQDEATFHKVATALNFPPTYVSALYHASGHAESSTFIKRGEEKECIGTSYPYSRMLFSQIGFQVFSLRIPTIIGILGLLQFVMNPRRE